MNTTQEVIWDFFQKTRDRLAKDHEKRINDPIAKQLLQQAATRIGLPKEATLDDVVRTLKLLSNEERQEKLKGIVN